MKKITITILLILLVCTACKKENNPLNKIKEVNKNIDNIQEAAKALNEAQVNSKELAKLKPVTKEQIKAWMPEKLGDLKRSSFQISKELGMTCKLVFKGQDNKSININIIDGAGTGAPMMAVFSMMQSMDIDKESDTGYGRTQKIDGQPMLVKYQSKENYEKSTLQCLLNERFGIEANAWNMTPDELWQYLKQLEIEKLIK